MRLKKAVEIIKEYQYTTLSLIFIFIFLIDAGIGYALAAVLLCALPAYKAEKQIIRRKKYLEKKDRVPNGTGD